MVKFSELQEINSYLDRYWKKYPNEISNDPTKQQIESWLNSGGLHFIKENIFILYQINDKLAEIVFYWCDMKDVPRDVLRRTLSNHKKFIKSLKVPVYSRAIKELFNRDYLVSFNNKTNLWRWI